MKALIEKYSSLFEQRVQRERIIIACVILALVYLVFDFFVFQTQQAQRDKIEQQNQAVQRELELLQTEKTALIQGLSNNPNIAKQREIKQLNARITHLNSEIHALSEGLIEADKLPQVIRDLLTHERGLTLLGLHAAPPEELALKGAGESEESVATAGIFKHSVVFRLQGSFFDLHRYLSALEKLEWHFYWESLDYEVEQYPRAVAQIEAYTLSTQRGFIGE